MAAATRLNVLVCAHEMSPSQGSECAVGWQIVTRLARHHDVTVLCASGSQHEPRAYEAAIKEHQRAHGLIDGLTFLFVDQPLASRLLAALNRAIAGTGGIGFPLLFYLALRSWHRAAYRRAAELDASAFDVIHHVTPIAFWGGSDLWKLGRPYVWGPIAGASGLLLPFARWLGAKVLLVEAARAAFNGLVAATSASVRRAMREAAVVLAVGREEAELVQRIRGTRATTMLETAAPTPTPPRPRLYDGSSRLRLCWSGQHIDRKALPLLLHALASCRLAERIELHVLGAGPRTRAWRELARRLAVPNVVWHGALPHGRALAAIREADALVHTAVREGTPHVVLEALARGLPVVCHDINGMSVAVTDQCGIKIPLVDADTSIRGFRAAVERLAESPLLLQALSAGAVKRASELSWDAKAAEIAEIYRRVAVARARIGTPAASAIASDRAGGAA